MARELYYTSFFNDPNLVSYYRLENTSDSKGTNTLTNNGGVPFNSAMFGNGADFGSSNSTMYLSGAYSYIPSSTSFSLVFWFKQEGTTQPFFMSFLSGNYEMYFGGDGNFHTQFSDNTGADTAVAIPGLTQNKWIHLGVTVDNSGGNVTMKKYANGNQLYSNTWVGKQTNNLGTLNISRTVYEGNIGTSGLFDDFAIFNRVLSPSEIYNIANGEGASFLFNFL